MESPRKNYVGLLRTRVVDRDREAERVVGSSLREGRERKPLEFLVGLLDTACYSSLELPGTSTDPRQGQPQPLF